jgi:hypothetical protein
MHTVSGDSQVQLGPTHRRALLTLVQTVALETSAVEDGQDWSV